MSGNDTIQTSSQESSSNPSDMPMLYSFNQLIAQRTREYPDLEILGIPDKNFNVSTMNHSLLGKLTGTT